MTGPIEIVLPDEAATRQLGEDLGLCIRAGDCLALHGDLGAGKSTLARALIRCVADDPDLDVPSPTFTLVQSYPLRVAVAHFDLYRIADPEELVELGLDAALADGAVLIEWPGNAGDRLPADAVEIRLDETPDGGRLATIAGPDEARDRIVRSLEIRAFLDASGRIAAARRFLLGDASIRSYETVRTGRGTELLMNAPRREIGPVLRDGRRYAEIAHVAEDIGPFVALDRFLGESGFRVPAIHAVDQPAGLALIEYLGDTAIVDDRHNPVAERWEAAIDCLAKLHRQDVPKALPNPGAGDHRVPLFDRDAMMIEVELFLEWYVPYRQERPATADERSAFISQWDRVIGVLQDAETGLVLRDFHSPNILWQAAESGIRRIGLIDFQDAMIGPVAYDVASLVQDARVTVEPGFAEHLVARYEAARRRDERRFDGAAFRSALAMMQAQRATKLLGLFPRLLMRDGKPGYVGHLGRIETYLCTTLKHPVLEALRPCYTGMGIRLEP